MDISLLFVGIPIKFDLHVLILPYSVSRLNPVFPRGDAGIERQSRYLPAGRQERDAVRSERSRSRIRAGAPQVLQSIVMVRP